MKIGPLNISSSRTTATGETKAAARPSKSSSAASTGEASAQVALSPAAATLMSSDDGSFDAAKVQRIADAIRDGKYQVNAEAIADKLIANAQELLGKGGH